MSHTIHSLTKITKNQEFLRFRSFNNVSDRCVSFSK